MASGPASCSGKMEYRLCTKPTQSEARSSARSPMTHCPRRRRVGRVGVGIVRFLVLEEGDGRAVEVLVAHSAQAARACLNQFDGLGWALDDEMYLHQLI